MRLLKKWVNNNVPAEFDMNSFAFCQLVSASFLWLYAKRLVISADEVPSADRFQYFLLFVALIFCLVSFHAANFSFKKPWANHQFLYLTVKIVRKLFVILYVTLPILAATRLIDMEGLSRLAVTVICACLALGWLSGFQEQPQQDRGEAT